jgi:small GTP-binding protein
MTDNVLKIVILGEGRVGKTSILSKYFYHKFNDGEKSTVNPAFYEKTVKYKGKTVQLKFWDTAGQEQFNAISTMYYQNAVGALLVYDVTIFETFQKVETWVHTLQEAVGKDITFVIAGNKVDLKDKNKSQEHTSEIDAYCAKEHCKHFLTSAKTGYNLDEAFDCLINSVLTKVKPEEGGGSKRRGKRIEISEQKEKKEKGGCC